MIEHTGVVKTKLLGLTTGVGTIAVVVVGGLMIWQVWKNKQAIHNLQTQLVSNPEAVQQLRGLRQMQTSLNDKIAQLETELDKLQTGGGKKGLFSNWFGKRQQQDDEQV